MYSCDRRRIVKAKLVKHHGGKCLDCGISYPPYIMQFDHRNPEEKTFNLSSGGTIAYQTQLEESLKCDLVCANCHFERTHRQRCSGCEYCLEDWDGEPYGGRPRKPKEPCKCGKPKSSGAKTCLECYKPKSKIEWPDIKDLKKMIEESNYIQVAKELGVSDNAIRKHIKTNE